MKIGIIVMSAKPMHVGHDALIRRAAAECDEVHLYVSLSDRKRPGEFPVLGSTMERIWSDYIERTLPTNVVITYTKETSPLRSAYQELGNANESNSVDEFIVYGDQDDLTKTFNPKALDKHYPNLRNSGRLLTMKTARLSSGTELRNYLSNDDKESFKAKMPNGVDGDAIWHLLKGQKNSNVESIIREYVVLIVNESRTLRI
jgi:nicotinamide mononucleotide adenylyltransferase